MVKVMVTITVVARVRGTVTVAVKIVVRVTR